MDLAERIVDAVLHTPDGERMRQNAAAAVRALLPAASGWVEVTGDPKTWPSIMAGLDLLTETEYEPGDSRRRVERATDVVDRVRAWADKQPPIKVRWMPWPAATPPAACAHGALLREVVDLARSLDTEAEEQWRRSRLAMDRGNEKGRGYHAGQHDALKAVAARLRAAADAAGKEGP